MKLAGGAEVFALTGGIGSGKSVVSSVWRELGLPVVDADQLARDVVAPGTPALQSIVSEFGPEVLTAEGTLDRPKLGALVFANETAREKLNGIVHPEVKAAAVAAFNREADKGEPLICYEIPLLFETKQEDKFHPVVVVSATPLQQMERVVGRDGLSPDEAAQRVNSQIPLREKEEKADVLIINSGTLDAVKARASAALEEVRAAVTSK